LGKRVCKKGALKIWISPNTDIFAFELDEIYWFTNARKGHEMGINTYIMTVVSRFPRQILSFEVDNGVKAELIQKMVDNLPLAENYFTDGCCVYTGVDFFGRHRRNQINKNDTYIIEGTNADLRHYIAGLRRKSRCFFRSFETLKAVLYLVINAYNKFGEAKELYKAKYPKYGRDYNFSLLNYI